MRYCVIGFSETLRVPVNKYRFHLWLMQDPATTHTFGLTFQLCYVWLNHIKDVNMIGTRLVTAHYVLSSFRFGVSHFDEDVFEFSRWVNVDIGYLRFIIVV